MSRSLKPLFIIPARGGSKGIPGKNIADLNGRPLIAYSIDAALEALDSYGRIYPADRKDMSRNGASSNVADRSRIIVSTDSEEIVGAARNCGVDVPFLRPAELSTDTAGSREVILHAMDWADAAGIDYDCVVLLQPTSPLRTGRHIVEAMELFASDIDADMAVSVREASANPYYNCFEQDASGALHISKGDGMLTRRQDAPKAWEYNGAVYVIRPDSIRRMPLGAFPRRIPYPMPALDSIDIDTPVDLEIARAILRSKSNS